MPDPVHQLVKRKKGDPTPIRVAVGDLIVAVAPVDSASVSYSATGPLQVTGVKNAAANEIEFYCFATAAGNGTITYTWSRPAGSPPPLDGGEINVPVEVT